MSCSDLLEGVVTRGEASGEFTDWEIDVVTQRLQDVGKTEAETFSHVLQLGI